MTTTLTPLSLSEADDSLLEGTFLDLAEKSSSDESVAVAAVVSSTFCNNNNHLTHQQRCTGTYIYM